MKSPDGFRVMEDPMGDGDEEVEVVISISNERVFQNTALQSSLAFEKATESFTFLWSWSTNVLNIGRLRKVMTTKPSSSTGGFRTHALSHVLFKCPKTTTQFCVLVQQSGPTVFHLVR